MFSEIKIRDITDLAKCLIVPVSVLVEVCYTCNEKCVHCCLDNHNQRGMSLKQYEMLFDQMVTAGTFFVILTGGEPFTRKDFMDIVRAARKRRLSVTIFTNGTLLSEKDISDIAKLFVQDVHVSIYSTNEKVHDSITQIPGSFRKSISAIRAMVKEGINVRIKCPLMLANANDISNLVKMAESLGAKMQFATTITARNDGDISTHKLQMSDRQLVKAIKHSAVSENISVSVRDKDDGNSVPCDTILNGGAIDPRGNVFPCNQWRICGGNVLHDNFGKIWKESEVFTAFRQIRLRNLVKCQTCEIFNYCTRCPGLALLEDNDICGCSASAKKVAEARMITGTLPTQRHIFSKI